MQLFFHHFLTPSTSIMTGQTCPSLRQTCHHRTRPTRRSSFRLARIAARWDLRNRRTHLTLSLRVRCRLRSCRSGLAILRHRPRLRPQLSRLPLLRASLWVVPLALFFLAGRSGCYGRVCCILNSPAPRSPCCLSSTSNESTTLQIAFQVPVQLEVKHTMFE